MWEPIVWEPVVWEPVVWEPAVPREAFPLAPQPRVQPASAMAEARAYRRPEACKVERSAELVAVWDAASLAGTAVPVPLQQVASPVGPGEQMSAVLRVEVVATKPAQAVAVPQLKAPPPMEQAERAPRAEPLWELPERVALVLRLQVEQGLPELRAPLGWAQRVRWEWAPPGWEPRELPARQVAAEHRAAQEPAEFHQRFPVRGAQQTNQASWRLQPAFRGTIRSFAGHKPGS